jgi:ABC-type Fe3+-hydroxamate transport system substrate-binding protein
MGSPTAFVGLGLLLALVGSACIYLSSAHQRWRAVPLPTRPARIVALTSSCASLLVLSRALDASAALLTFFTWNMLLLVALPYVGATLCARKGR